MYTNFFGFHTKPFSMTPDPAFFYPSEAHRDGLANLRYGIKESMGFIVLTGEVGTGKTLLIRSLLEELGTEVKRALILNPILDPDEMFGAILKDLEVPFDESSGFAARLDQFNEFLIEEYTAGRRVVVIIDESQNLSVEALERLRLLSNLETDTAKLLQIILVGQPELNALLSKPAIRQLDQRVTVRHHLKPFTADETPKYIEHRIEVASEFSPKVVFEKGAIKLIHKASGGIPRLIGVLCDYSLLIAFTEDKRTITTQMAKEAIDKYRKQQKLYEADRRTTLATRLAWGVGVVVLCAGVFGSGFFLAKQREGKRKPLPKSPLLAAPEISLSEWKDEEFRNPGTRTVEPSEQFEVVLDTGKEEETPLSDTLPERTTRSSSEKAVPMPPASGQVRVASKAPSPKPTNTPEPPTATETPSPTVTDTATPTPTNTATQTPTATATPTDTASPTLPPTAANTPPPIPSVAVLSDQEKGASGEPPLQMKASEEPKPEPKPNLQAALPEQPRDEEILAIEANPTPLESQASSQPSSDSSREPVKERVMNWPTEKEGASTKDHNRSRSEKQGVKKYAVYRVSGKLSGQYPHQGPEVPAKYGVQLASLQTWERALRMARDFRHLGPIFLVPWTSPEGEEWVRVVLGIYRNRPTAFQMIQYLQHTYRITDALIVENRWWRIDPEVGGIEKLSDD